MSNTQSQPSIRAAITGTGFYVPDYVLTNKELETMVDTTEEWITSRTGILERRILKEPGQGITFMAERAVKQLLEKKNLSPLDIDLVIFSTITGDMIFPASANIVCDKVGMKNAWGFDLAAACSGFLYGLSTGSQFIQTGKYKKVIVIGGDKMSSIIDYTDRATCIIFGDGCAAVLLEPSEDENGLIDFELHSDGSGRQYLHQKAGGSALPPSHETIDARQHYVYQEGQAVYKFAVTNMAEVSVSVMERNHLVADDIDWLVPHQANKRIIDSTRDRMGLDPAKVMMNIEHYGNTTNGTIPLLLAEYEPRLKKGDNLILSAFGGGFTWGAIYLKWAYNS
jgi:3-oxoacyl-[acyl-carrier-protein] synthase-3